MRFSVKDVEVSATTTVYAVEVSVQYGERMYNASCVVFHDWDANTDSNAWYISHVEPEEVDKAIREVEERILAQVHIMQDRKEVITAEGKLADWVTTQDRHQSEIYAQRNEIRKLEVEKGDLQKALREKEEADGDTERCAGG